MASLSYEARNALICSSCSEESTNCWLSWKPGLSPSHPKILAAAEAKSLSLPLQFRFVAPSCSAACSDALAVACARPVLVLPSSSLCVSTNASATGCKLDALNVRPGLPPGRLGSCHPPRRAHDLPVGIGTSSLRQAALSPISRASILNASLLTVLPWFSLFIRCYSLLAICG